MSARVGRATNCTHYCGRRSSYKSHYGIDCSYLGNPKPLLNEADRDAAVNEYQVYFDRQIMMDPVFATLITCLVQIATTQNIVLGCFCHPKRCHCDIIAGYINRKIRE